MYSPLELYTSGPETLYLPRILCLHGAGTTAQIFHMQMRMLTPQLAKHFRLVFVDGPFVNDMHPDMYPFYSDLGPFRSWGRWLPHQEWVSAEETIERNEFALTEAMDADEGEGEWVGILGFSMGAMLASSILIENQRRRDGDEEPFAGVDFKFGILLAGRAAPYALSDATLMNPRFRTPSDTTPMRYQKADSFSILRTPTLHVHGLHDPGLSEHRDLFKHWCTPNNATLVEWGGGHRIPIKSRDVLAVKAGILEVAKNARVLPDTMAR